jgi:serine/threonine-protein kinase
MSASPLAPGEVLAGRYRIDRLLGTGNMGVVVAATHIDLQKRVAVKFMLPGHKQKEQHERFLREARVVGSMQTQHVAKVFDVGKLDSGAPYMVMELLEGKDLGVRLREDGALPVGEAVGYALQACEAVAEAHALGIVHRDLKPANLFVTTDLDAEPCVKVLDFGVAKDMTTNLGLTETGGQVGSPLYMSPEQIRSSADVDVRSDVWSLGVVLYELVAGKPPFGGVHVHELYTRVLFEAPTPLATYRPDAPAGLEAVLLHAMEKERERRFASVAELCAALAPYASSRDRVYVERVAGLLGENVQPARPTLELSAAAASAPAAPPPPSAVGGGTEAAVVRVSPAAAAAAPRPGRRAALVGAALAACAAVAVAVVLVRGRAVGPATETPATGAPATSILVPAVAPPAAAAEPPPSVATAGATEADASAPAPAAKPSASPSARPVAATKPKPPAPAPDVQPKAPPPKPATTFFDQ